jgi:Na+/melibiose symporter-like transporter
LISEGLSTVDYFALYGPFAVLFVSLFYWTLKTAREREEVLRRESREREELLREEIILLRADTAERSRHHYEVLSEFAKKYDIVIDRLDELRAHIHEVKRT